MMTNLISSSSLDSSSPHEKQVIDKRERELALDPAASIICEAPAGSGKTELLTQRFLRLLARVEKPEEILAITFTRKAAGEMRERILKSLNYAQTHPEPDAAHEKITWKLASDALDVDKRYRWNLIKNPNRLQVSTFDSVCSGLANALPWHSNFVSPPEVLDDSIEVYRAAARAMLASVEQEFPWQEALKHILKTLDNNTQKLEKLFITILMRREAWLPLMGGEHLNVHDEDSKGDSLCFLNELLAGIAQQAIVAIHELISEPIARELVELASFAAHNLQGGKNAIASCENLHMAIDFLPEWDANGINQWKDIIGLMFTNTGTWRKTVNKNNGFPAGENAEEKKAFKEKKQQFLALIEKFKSLDGLETLFVDVLNLPGFEYDEQQSEFLFSLFQVLPTLSAMLTVEFRQRNSVDFSEISLRATEALGDLDNPSELALALDYKLRHILVDEFQDTSPSQIRLLTRLTSGWEAGDGRTLFCVGDAMQSIYGFRGANVGLFLHCLQHGLGEVSLDPIKLSTNFRSQSTVVEWVNSAFSFAFPKVNDITDGAVQYSSSEPFNAAGNDACVTTHLILSEPDMAKSDHDHHVVKLVQEAKERGSESVAILVRSRGHVARVAPLLNEQGIKFRAVELDPLQGKPEVGDVIALTLALISQANRVAWLSVLRAPWCGLNLVDLEVVATYLGDAIVSAERESKPSSRPKNTLILYDQIIVLLNDPSERRLSSDGKNRLRNLVSVLDPAIQNAYRKPIRQWVEGTWKALQGPATLHTQSAFNNVQMVFELLESLDDGSGVLSEKDLNTAVEKLYASPDPNADGSVQVMTIHKSKGLEFDTVIIPALEKPGRSDDPELLSWYERVDDDGRESIVLAPIKASGSSGDPISQHVQYQLKKKSRYESCRLLYVACTRAKRQLHLVASASKSDKGEWKAPPKNALMSHIFDYVVRSNTTNVIDLRNSNKNEQITGSEIRESENTENKNTDIAKYHQRLTRLKSNFSPQPMAYGRLLENYIPYYEHDNTQEESDKSNIQYDLIQYDLAFDNVERGNAAWASDVGTLIHEIIHNAAENGWSDSLFDPDLQAQVWRQSLSTAGVSEKYIQDAVDNTSELAEKIKKDKNIHWMLKEQHKQRLSEFSIKSTNGNAIDTIKENIIDLIIVDSQNTWLIDFKTSAPAEGESKEAFLLHQKKKYLEVMRKYTQLLLSIGYENLVVGLYFPSISAWASYSGKEIAGVVELGLPC